MSSELVSYLYGMRIATSRTSAYNARRNGQFEKYNDTIWSAVLLALKNRNLPVSEWESVLPQVPHSIRSILCTATNVTPHGRFLGFQRRSTVGIAVPSWLSSPGLILVKRHVRSSKYESLVEEADLIHATLSYAHVRFRNGHETKVSLRDVAPLANRDSLIEESDHVLGDIHENESSSEDEAAPHSSNAQSTSESSTTSTSNEDQVQVGSPRPSIDIRNSGEFPLPSELENDFWIGPTTSSDTTSPEPVSLRSSTRV